MIEPKNVEYRVSIVGNQIYVDGIYIGIRHPKETIEYATRKLVLRLEDTVEMCCAKIRAKCTSCDEHGNSEVSTKEGVECMYCGVPMRHLRELKIKQE